MPQPTWEVMCGSLLGSNQGRQAAVSAAPDPALTHRSVQKLPWPWQMEADQDGFFFGNLCLVPACHAKPLIQSHFYMIFPFIMGIVYLFVQEMQRPETSCPKLKICSAKSVSNVVQLMKSDRLLGLPGTVWQLQPNAGWKLKTMRAAAMGQLVSETQFDIGGRH